MKYFWLGVAGLSTVLLLGHLFADYVELRFGVARIVGLVAVLVAIAGGINVVLYCTQRDKVTRAELKGPITASVWLGGGILTVLFILMTIGGM